MFINVNNIIIISVLTNNAVLKFTKTLSIRTFCILINNSDEIFETNSNNKLVKK